jgi:predicted pyridoxine 5'-phosphate oxidase superfamily flavin-nucleotide-binding protein
MKIPENCREFLLQAEGKALATYSPKTGVHVVPVSSIKVDGDTIILVNYFFGQTLSNIEQNPQVSLAAWKGLSGYQIKAKAKYETAGPLFALVVEWIAETIPGRVVKGILLLDPTQIFDVSAGKDAGKEISVE